MVFATEFDPIDQSQRRQADQVKRAQATEQSALPAQQTLKIGHSRLSQSNQTQFLIAQATPAQPIRAGELARPVALGLVRSHSASTGESLTPTSRQSRGKLTATSADISAVTNKVVPLHLGSSAVRVQADPDSELALSFPDKSKLPWRLKLLNRVQQGSTMVTGLLFTGALIAYGSTVYMDKSTDRALLQLDALQSESQQLTSVNEAIKQSLAEQAAQASSGLEPYGPEDALFLSPEPKRSPRAVEQVPAKMPRPLGY